jgi:hypothetical protein
MARIAYIDPGYQELMQLALSGRLPATARPSLGRAA